MNLEITQSYDYSFRSQFNNFSLLKKFISIMLLPFLPIYTVSKGFQMRKWKKKQSVKPPRIWLYIIIMLLIYFFTIYPLAIAIVYVVFQIYLFPVSFIIAFLLNRKDITLEEKIEIDGMKREFLVIGFRRKSITFFVLFMIVLLTGNIFFLFAITAVVFILFPQIYRRIYFIPKRLLALSYPFLGFLSYIPGVNLKGTWFIEADSEIKKLKSGTDIIRFIIGNWKPFFLLNVGISALITRIILFLRGDPPVQSILSLEALSSAGFLLIFWIVPVIMAIYFVWIWVWEDAELKVAKTSISTAGMDEKGDEIIETSLLTFASDSISNTFTLAFGLPSVVWLVDKMVTTDELSKGGIFGLAVILITFFLFTGIASIFMGIMYYRSGIHTELVNKLRDEIKKSYTSNEDTSVKICYSSVRPIPIDS